MPMGYRLDFTYAEWSRLANTVEYAPDGEWVTN